MGFSVNASGTITVSSPYVKISSGELGAPAANMDITGIPTGYAFLRLLVYAKITGNGNVVLTFNGDGGNNYLYQLLYGEGAATGALTTTQASFVWNLGTANLYGTLSGEIENTTAARVKSFQFQVGQGAGKSHVAHGYWNNTTAEISRITITAGVGNLDTGSKYVLLGVKI